MLLERFGQATPAPSQQASLPFLLANLSVQPTSLPLKRRLLPLSPLPLLLRLACALLRMPVCLLSSNSSRQRRLPALLLLMVVLLGRVGAGGSRLCMIRRRRRA